MKYYIIVNNSCQSKKKDHLLNIYKPFQDRITHHLSDVEPLQEREKSQSRGDFQKMRAKQQMDEDLQGYQVFHPHYITFSIFKSKFIEDLQGYQAL